MIIDIRADVKQVQEELKAIGRQAPFALALGITRTTQDAQRAMQARMPQVFQLRGTERLFRNAVKMTSATKTKPEGAVRIQGPETPKGPDARVARIILRHEDGGQKSSDAMYRLETGRMKALGFFLPAKGLRSPAGRVPQKLYPRAIGVASRMDASGASFFAKTQKGRKVKKGEAQRELSYFVSARGGVYERRVFGSGSAIRLLWWLRPQISLRPRLGFFDTVERVMDERYRPNLLRAIDEALRTARPGGGL